MAVRGARGVVGLTSITGTIITGPGADRRLVAEAERAGLAVIVEPALCRPITPATDAVAVRRLTRLLAGFDVPEYPVRLAPLGVVSRRSTDIVAYADPLVADAVRFIQGHFGDGIGVPDVAAAIKIGRRTLERRFQRLVGHSVLAEITRARLDRARFLLATTDLPLRAVAQQCGFESAAGLSVAHRAAFSSPPGEYRRTSRDQAG